MKASMTTVLNAPPMRKKRERKAKKRALMVFAEKEVKGLIF
jgi:hypothetical protein